MSHRVRPIEWAMYAVSAAIVASTVIGAMVLDARGGKDDHPRVEAKIDGRPWPDGDTLVVPWVATNPTPWNLKDVTLSVTDGRGDGPQQVISYLPRGAEQRGVVRLHATEAEVKVEVLGWRLP